MLGVNRRAFSVLCTHRSLREPLPQLCCHYFAFWRHHITKRHRLHLAQKALFLRFPSLVPSQSAPCQRPRTNQRRTKEHPKNSKTKNVRFIKIAVSFLSLIPSLILPTDEREKTERRAKRYRALAAKNSALLLRLLF